MGAEYNNYSSSFGKYKFSFFKKKCLTFSLSTDKNDIIRSMHFRTKIKIDKNYFNLLIEKYGEPSQMMKIGEIIEEKEEVYDDYIANSVNAEAMPCSFNENPLLIRWEKSSFTLQIQMDYQKNNSFFLFTAK